MDEQRKRTWQWLWLLGPFVFLGLCIAGAVVFLRMDAAGAFLSADEKQAACAAAEEALAKEEAQAVVLIQSHRALLRQVHGEVLDDILSRKDEVSDAERDRRIDAAINNSTSIATVHKLMLEQTMKITHAKERLAESQSRLAK